MSTLGTSTTADGPQRDTAAPERAHPRRTAAIRGSAVAGLAVLGNLAILGVAHLAGAPMRVAPPGQEAATVGPLQVVTATLVGVVVGTALLVAAAARGRGVRVALAWAGLALGVLTTAMPMTAEATAGSQTALAAMHVLTGAVWFVLLRRGD